MTVSKITLLHKISNTLGDGLHPNTAGYQKYFEFVNALLPAEVVISVLDRNIKISALPASVSATPQISLTIPDTAIADESFLIVRLYGIGHESGTPGAYDLLTPLMSDYIPSNISLKE